MLSATVRRFSHAAPRTGRRHAHAEGQLFVQHQGSSILRTAQATWLMPAGRFCWVPPGLPHSADSRGAVAGVSVFLPTDACAGLPQELRVVWATPLLRALVDALASGGLSAERVARLVPVLRDEIAETKPYALHLPMPATPRLLAMAEAIFDDPADARDLAAWSKAVGMSERSLTRHFRAETGLSFIEFRRRARLIRATTLIEGGMSITEAALAAGYSSLSGFNAVRRELG